MTVRKPLVIVDGELQELPVGDSLPVPDYSPMTPEEAETAISTEPKTIAPVVLKGAVKKWAVMPSALEEETFSTVSEMVGSEVARVEYQAHSEATTVAALVADFNSLIDKLKAAGIMLSE